MPGRQRGLAVHPCNPATQQPYTLWTKAATTTPSKIKAFWERWPDALIAVVTGNGLVAIVDERGLAEPDSSLPATLTARTSRGHTHLYQTPVRVVPCSDGKMAANVNIRGDAGYVLTPPTSDCAWLDAVAPITELRPGVITAVLRRCET